MIQPLFPRDKEESDDTPQQEAYILHGRHSRRLEPLTKHLVPPSPKQHYHDNPAASLVRSKVEAAYQTEPSARQEAAEAVAAPKPRSKHQQFMFELSTSGKPLAQIQVEWHNYYLHLPDNEKFEVWQEFYENNARRPSAYTQHVQQQPVAATGGALPVKPVVMEHSLPTMPHSDRRSARTIKRQIVEKVAANSLASERAKQHLRSVVFGLGTGFLVLLIFMFGFFNEVIIAPFIQPSRHVSATPIIVSADSVAASDVPEVIIPKINVQIPVIYDASSIDEASIQKSLESGVVHYATTSLPGQQGNTAIFGHSSNNIFNKGKYKFAFVLLHTLAPGDIFYLTYNKQIYTYRVYDRKVVAPSEVSVLDAVADKPATATLITCDPPGTSNNRLVVWGEQISPDPSKAAPSTAVTATGSTTPTALTSEGPSLWSRLIHFDF